MTVDRLKQGLSREEQVGLGFGCGKATRSTGVCSQVPERQGGLTTAAKAVDRLLGDRALLTGVCDR